MPADSFADAFADEAKPFPQDALGRGSWELENDELSELRTKILSNGAPLSSLVGAPILGVKTGRDEPFLISRAKACDLINHDPSSQNLIFDHLVGDDLEKWHHETPDRKAIYIKKASISISDYPAIETHLLAYRDSLEDRATTQAYYEWQQAQAKNKDDFSAKKIIYPLMSQSPKFSLDRSGSLTNQNTFVIKSNDLFLLAILNSSVIWFVLSGIADSLRGGVWCLVLKSHFVAQVPIPSATDEQKAALRELATSAQAAAEKRYELQQAIIRRIPDLASDPANTKLTNKLKTWWSLPDFAAFQSEVEKALKATIPLQERNDWETWINNTRAEIQSLTTEIARLEAEINAKVYALFYLTPDEIALLEASV